MIELWQTEWCPASQRVRQRLTELGVPFVARPVPVDRAERRALREATGGDAVPALVRRDGSVLADEDEILAWLDATYPEPADAAAHRARAERVRVRALREAAAAAGLDPDLIAIPGP